jgi:hypothetical protein
VIRRVAYDCRRYGSAEECLKAIRERVHVGWRISEIQGPERGPFAVLFRMDEPDEGEPGRPTPEQARQGTPDA